MANGFCPYCGQPVNASSTFCPNCGNALGEATQPVQPMEPQPAASWQPNPTPPPAQGKNQSTLFIILGVLTGMVLSMLAIAAFWIFSDEKRDSATADSTVVVADTIVQSPPAETLAETPEPAAPAAPAAPAVTLRSGGEFRYSGTIAGQRVVMTLVNNGGEVTGSYRYTKFSGDDRLALVGTLTGAKLELYEVNEDGESTGYISARLSDTGISGKFTKTESGKQFNVYLTQQ
ncbi:MAG: zinc-ribbon domain-containing protein [Bacteroidaceae bacterium]|nr:zinc-ribbon domain-containing protein [Bacteroidaceae bacterium]